MTTRSAMIAMLLCVGFGLQISAASAQPSGVGVVRLHVGATGIHCVKTPCPARAVFEPGPGGKAERQRMIYIDLDGKKPAPPMMGADKALAAIRSAWDSRECIAIDGRLIGGVDDQPVLRVDRIVGPCGQG